jgi:hypothetical protein
MDESLGLNTVRAIVTQKNGTDRTTRRYRRGMEGYVDQRERDPDARKKAIEFKRRRRTGALPRYCAIVACRAMKSRDCSMSAYAYSGEAELLLLADQDIVNTLGPGSEARACAERISRRGGYRDHFRRSLQGGPVCRQIENAPKLQNPRAQSSHYRVRHRSFR